jgi:hypothetical protein
MMGWVVNNKSENMRKEAVVAYIIPQLLEVTEENHEKRHPW